MGKKTRQESGRKRDLEVASEIEVKDDSSHGKFAPWFRDEISRRAAARRLGKGLALGSGLGIAGLTIYKITAGSDDEVNLDSLELQKREGWNVGSTAKPLTFSPGSQKQLDSLGRTDWKEFLEPSRLIAAVQPAGSTWQPFFVPTLIQGLSQSSLREQLNPLSTPSMIDASNRAQGLGELISQSQNAKETLLIADLPGPMSVAVGAALADKLAVVPTFDNWPHPLGVVRAHETLGALVNNAREIEEKKAKLPADAPAIMLLDSDRLTPYQDADSQFDNRYIAKIPPVDELKKRGIKNVLYLVPNEARKEELDDLNDEFVDWQKNGIEVRMLQLDDFKPYDENVTTTNAAGAPVVAPERHYYYGGSPMLHWWFFSHYMYRPYPTVFVTRGGQNVPLGRPPVSTSPPPSTRAQSYRPVSRSTMFASSRVGGAGGVGRNRPSGFGRSSVRVSGGRVTGTRAGRSGSWGRSSGWFGG